MANKDKTRLLKGEASKIIMAEIEAGINTVAGIEQALTVKNIKISRPLIYRVLRNSKKINENNTFSVRELIKVKLFVADAGTLDRARQLLDAFGTITEN